MPDQTTIPNSGVGSAVSFWRMAAWISGVFSALVALTMLLGELGYEPVKSLTSPQLAEFKANLRREPNNEQIKNSIRELDLKQRRHYFRQLSQMHSGAYLLLAGVAAFVVAATRLSHLQKQLPMPKPRPEGSDPHPRAATARWAVAGAGAAIGVFLFALQLAVRNSVPEQQAAVEKLFGSAQAATAENDAAPAAEMKRNWPRFRGPEGSGVSPFTNAPREWDVKTGAGIIWKVPVPAPGFNSPITWGERVFFSGGNASKREVFCLDAKTGQTIWRQDITKVPGSPAQPPEIPETTGYAACTMATDGRRVYVAFANGDLAAFSLDGKPVWSKSFGPLKNPYGYATSLATWSDKIILQLDQGESEDGKSKLYALDGRTGQVVWQRPRKVGCSWATPIVIEAGGKPQIITLAVPWVISYGATDGSELWHVEGLNGEITPSAVFAAGLVMVPSPSDRMMAIRPNGQGDVTKTAMTWTSEENVPDVTSPVSSGDLVFTITTPGLLTCCDASNGKKVWEHDYDMEFHSSPAIAGDRLYLFGQKGAAIVVQAGREFKELFRTEMGDAFHASPAFLDGKIIMRGTTNIWCLGQTSPPAK